MGALLARLLAGPGLKWMLLAILLLAAGGGGFAWGESRGLAIAATAAVQGAAKDADARVAAVRTSDQAMINDYLAKLTVQARRSDALSTRLAEDEAKLADMAKAAQEKLSHALPQNPACDLPPDAVVLLNTQPARQ